MAVAAWIFDLDQCLLDTGRLGQETNFFQPVLDVVAALAMDEAQRAEMLRLMWIRPFDDIIRRLALPDHLSQPIEAAYRQLEIPSGAPVHGFGDAEVIATLPGVKILVTTGYTRLQHSKIAGLGIAPLFAEVLVDQRDDPATRPGKKRIFAELMQRYGWRANEVVVLGDNPESELAAGLALGMVTVQTLRPGVSAWDGADHHVADLRDLYGLFACAVSEAPGNID